MIGSRIASRVPRAKTMGFLWALLGLVLHVLPGAVDPAHAQGSRKDDIVFNSRGIPLAGATVRVCTTPASGQPCTPLALIYSDSALTQALANPTATDGLGNYFFYAAPGKYEIEISGPSITTKQIPNVILPNDPSAPNFSGAVTAFSLTLSGNLSVSGNTTVVGNLASGTLNLTNQSAAPGTAGSGTVNLYTKTADKRLYYKDDTGTEVGPVGAGAQTTTVNTFTANQNFDGGFVDKGPDPYADIRRYGKFGTFSSTTANTTASSASVGLTSAQSFQSGEYVTVYNAGAANSISAMGTVTLTPSSNAGGLNTTAANAGSSSFGYKVIAADKFGGYTSASAEASTTTGNALGMQTIGISTMSRSGTVVTVTTSAAHPFVVGSMVFIQYGGGNTDGSFNGWFIVDTSADTTHFTFKSGYDTASGASTSDTGGTVIGFNCNHLTWTTVTGAWKYYIYGRTKGGPWNLLGVTMLTYFNDYGSPMNDNQTFPAFIPTTAPSTGANDHLTAKITAGGGTTTLTLASNAGATLTGTGIVSDDGPAILAAITADNVVYIPSVGATISSYTALPNGGKLLLNGTLSLNDTLSIHGNTIEGLLTPNQPAFSWEGTAPINGSAYPMLTAQFGATVLKRVTVNCTASNGCLDYYDNGSTEDSFDYVNWSTGSGTTSDYLGMHALFNSCGFSYRFDKNLFSTGSPGTNLQSNVGFSPIPSVLFQNQNGQAACPSGNFGVTRSWFVARGSIDQDYVATSGGVNWWIVKDIQTQNSFLPPFMQTGALAASGGFDFQNITPADFPTAVFANLANNRAQISGASMSYVSCGQGGFGSVTGNGVNQFAVAGVCNPGQNTGFVQQQTGQFTNNSVQVNGTAGGMGYQLGTPAPPTLSISGSSGPVAGTYTYKVIAIDVFGGISGISAASASQAVNGSQGILVSVTLVPGQVFSRLCRSNGGGYACGATGASFKFAGTTLLDNGGLDFSASPPSSSTGFSTGIASSGLATQSLNVTGGGFTSTANGTFTANRAITLPDASLLFPNTNGTVPTSGYQNSAYDNFNRANGAIGSNWTVTQNGFNVTSNVIQGTSAGGNNIAFWNPNTFSNFGQFAQVTVTALNGTTDFVGPAVYGSSGANTYECVENTTTLAIQKIVANVRTNLVTAALTGAVGDRLLLSVTLNPATLVATLTCYQNGVQQLQTTDSTFSSGSPGIMQLGNVATMDNWSGGNLHPISQLDAEQDWIQPQHFIQGGTHSGPETFSNINGDVFFDGTKYTTIQAALNACSGSGLKVVIPPGSYTLTSGLTSNCTNLEFRGVSGTGDEISSSTASTVCPVTIVVPSGAVGFTFNPSGSSTNFRGPTIRDICFVGASGATGGIRILRTNNFTIDHVGASYFSGSGAYGIFSDGTGNFNQYGVISNSTLAGNNIDIKTFANKGLRIAFNHLDNAANGSAPTAGTKGIYFNCPSSGQDETHQVIGNVIVGSDILIDSECGQNDMIGFNRFENFTTAAIRLQQLNSNTANGTQIFGGSINNFINGSVGTGVIVASGVSNARVDIQDVASVATAISDSGSSTVYFVNKTLQVPQDGLIQFGSAGDNAMVRDASGRLKITNNLLLNQFLCLNNIDTCIQRGSAGVISSPNGTLGQVIASGTATLGTSAIASNSCATTVTVAAAGVATTDAISWSFNADPNGVTGYGAGSTGTLSIWPFPTSGNVNFRVCNLTGGSITPGAATLNWRVTR